MGVGMNFYSNGLFLLLILLLGWPALAVEGVNESSIKIGVVNVTSGPAQNLGKGVRKGIEAYFKENTDKIHGRSGVYKS